MSRCNYCMCEDMRRFAESTGQVLTLVRSMEGDWIDAYIDPPDAPIKTGWVASFQKLPEKCVC